MALRFGHCEAQLPGIFKHPDQNLQAQQVRMLRRDHFKYCLQRGGGKKRLTTDWALNKKVEEAAKRTTGCQLETVT